MGFERRELDPAQRRGLLTSAAFLRASFHPNVLGDRYVIMQGKTIRERILCEGLPPPIELPPDAPRPEDYGTAREFSDALIEHPTCGGCHGLMDPIGRGFAHYEATGRFMLENADGPVDATGEVRGSTEPGLGGTFQGVPEFASRLSQSDSAESCFVRQFSRYALSRLDEQADGCSVVSATDRMNGWGWHADGPDRGGGPFGELPERRGQTGDGLRAGGLRWLARTSASISACP